jgi:hypothetical protein
VVKVFKPGTGVSEFVKALVGCGEAGASIFLTKPSPVAVYGPGGRVFEIVVPPASLAADRGVFERCGLAYDYVVAEDSWVEGGFAPAPGDVVVEGGCLLAEHVRGVFGGCSAGGRCRVLCRATEELLAKYLLNPMVADLRGLEGVSVSKYSGSVRVLWSSHPVLYGVNLGELVEVELALVEGTQLRYYAKPLAYIDGEPLVLEVPYSNSILFAGYADGMGELAVRSVLYTCLRSSSSGS